ncbi:hypothetical protein HPB52_014968 [Rhipicephalus sanguineus]|uniref:RFX-type winged-helix domain-containing protein n=1 Tax=Rhipicephalus sanguineus TaxID=34632 RepID=A0A9D4SUH8_RHISA|nr:hypothetical protein HPB52_014968 [Rhipicephalus sanguineus]
MGMFSGPLEAEATKPVRNNWMKAHIEQSIRKSSGNPLGKKADAEVAQTYTWIQSHLEEDPETSLPKQEVYEEYRSFFEKNKIEPLCAADFGKVMKHVFPSVRPRRLGTRGNSRYCYSGLRKKCEMKSPTLPDLSAGEDSLTKASGECPEDGSEEEREELSQASWLLVREWAEKVLSHKFPTVRHLARHLVDSTFVDARSMAAVTVLSAKALSTDKGSQASSAPRTPGKRREAQQQLQRKLQEKKRLGDQKRKLTEQRSHSAQSSQCSTPTEGRNNIIFVPTMQSLQLGSQDASGATVATAPGCKYKKIQPKPATCRSTAVVLHFSREGSITTPTAEVVSSAQNHKEAFRGRRDPAVQETTHDDGIRTSKLETASLDLVMPAHGSVKEEMCVGHLEKEALNEYYGNTSYDTSVLERLTSKDELLQGTVSNEVTAQTMSENSASSSTVHWKTSASTNLVCKSAGLQQQDEFSAISLEGLVKLKDTIADAVNLPCDSSIPASLDQVLVGANQVSVAPPPSATSSPFVSPRGTPYLDEVAGHSSGQSGYSGTPRQTPFQAVDSGVSSVSEHPGDGRSCASQCRLQSPAGGHVHQRLNTVLPDAPVTARDRVTRPSQLVSPRSAPLSPMVGGECHADLWILISSRRRDTHVAAVPPPSPQSAPLSPLVSCQPLAPLLNDCNSLRHASGPALPQRLSVSGSDPLAQEIQELFKNTTLASAAPVPVHQMLLLQEEMEPHGLSGMLDNFSKSYPATPSMNQCFNFPQQPAAASDTLTYTGSDALAQQEDVFLASDWNSTLENEPALQSTLEDLKDCDEFSKFAKELDFTAENEDDEMT